MAAKFARYGHTATRSTWCAIAPSGICADRIQFASSITAAVFPYAGAAVVVVTAVAFLRAAAARGTAVSLRGGAARSEQARTTKNARKSHACFQLPITPCFGTRTSLREREIAASVHWGRKTLRKPVPRSAPRTAPARVNYRASRRNRRKWGG